ncbi:hypothetical protein R5R35_010579 [Gryllus longicercus]|uniref:VWFA domain-containing protein n=1 Tax=Gryllus longicercus TaxID=2509291 RepID=A0AAN9Z3L3_9ORTH
MQQMKEAMAAILSELSEGDAFSLVTFSAETRVWVRGLGFVAATEGRRNTVVGATSDMVLEAREVVGQLQHQPTAGTQLLSAVLAAYRAVREGREWAMDGAPRQPLVLLLAGGQDISAERSELLRAVAAASADPAACAPLYSLAFGRDADWGLLKQLSLRGKGFARRIYEAADAALQLRNFYRRVASPLLADVSFHYADDQVEASSLTRAAFPVLLAGAELAVAGVGVGEGVGGGLRATVRGAAGGRRLERAAAVQRVEPQQASFVERLWAYLTVRQLLERADGGDAQAKERARELALRYAFVALGAGTELKSDGKMAFAYESC